jgi:hypothetical protein
MLDHSAAFKSKNQPPAKPRADLEKERESNAQAWFLLISEGASPTPQYFAMMESLMK